MGALLEVMAWALGTYLIGMTCQLAYYKKSPRHMIRLWVAYFKGEIS